MYVIKLKTDAKPFSLTTPRRVPVPLLSKNKELARMEQMHIISKVGEPTKWCAGMVGVPKANNKVWICVDLTRLNERNLGEFQPLPCVDQTPAQLADEEVFSKLDANSGFWQIGLSPELSNLANPIMPFGWFCFNRLAFGVSLESENFQTRISQVLEGTEGSLCQMDNILVFSKSFKEHNEHLKETLYKLQEANLTLNKEKCKFVKPSVEFFGTIFNAEGIQCKLTHQN